MSVRSARSTSVVVHPCKSTAVASKNPTTIAPAVPAGALWMWPRVIVPRLLVSMSQQTRLCPTLTVMLAVPLPSGSPRLQVPLALHSLAPESVVVNLRPPSATGSAIADTALSEADASSVTPNSLPVVMMVPPAESGGNGRNLRLFLRERRKDHARRCLPRALARYRPASARRHRGGGPLRRSPVHRPCIGRWRQC